MRKKMKTILLLLLTVIFAAPVYSNGDGTWVTQTSGSIQNLRGVHFIDANTGTTVGHDGTILRTTNSGTNWITQTSGTTQNINAVVFTDANTGVVVGGGGVILRTTNGGTNWVSQSSGTSDALWGVSFIDGNTGTVIGGVNIILRTTNGGTNWISQPNGASNGIVAVSFSDINNGLVVGYAGTILRTTNGGSNWTIQNAETSEHLYSVSFIDANTGIVAGAFRILRTTNGGTNWIVQDNFSQIFIGVSLTNANIGTVVGTSGTIQRTSNGGINWTTQTSGTSTNLHGVYFSDANNGTAVGGSGTILRYKANPNYGDNEQSADNLYYFANSTTGAANSPSQPVFDWRDTTGSTDLIVNGVSIATLGSGNIDDGRYDIISQLPPGNSIKFFGTDYSDLYIGTNGIIGFTSFVPVNTWDVGNGSITGLPQNFIPSMATAIYPLWIDLDYSNINVPVNRLSYKVTSNEVIITYDRAPIPGGDVQDYVSFQVVISHSPTPTQNSKIVFQFDDAASGMTFIHKYNTNTLPAHISGLQGSYSTSQFLQYRYRSSTLLITEGPLFGSPLAVAFGPDDNALPVDLILFNAVVDNRDVTLNWTTAWEENNMRFDIQRRNAEPDVQWTTVGSVNGSGTVFEERNYSFTDKNLFTGKYEYRLVQIDYDGNSTADFDLNQTIEVGVPTRFDLSQNYPNPFNPTTKINYEIPVESFVRLVVYDMTGREVAMLVNNTVTPGYYTTEFTASSFASGVYFYRLIIANNVITKKMILLK